MLGEIGGRVAPGRLRLPVVTDLYPELLDSARPEDDAPSCSLAEALEKQELFVNQAVGTLVLNILWRLFRFGKLHYHGGFINLASERTVPLPVDPAVWARMGHIPPTPEAA